MPRIKPSIMAPLEESIKDSQDTLERWIAETDDPSAKAAFELIHAITPGWCHWLKESGATGQMIVHAVTVTTAHLILETIGNLSDEEDHDKLARAILYNLVRSVKEGIETFDQAEPLKGFRRKDS